MAATPTPSSPFRTDCLEGKVALITGGATGIGLSICKELGRHGAKVAIAARRKHVIDEAVAQLRSEGIDAFGTTADVRDYGKCEAAVAAVVDHFGRLDILVNNAAGNFMVSAENLTPNGFATVLGIDLQGCFNMCKACRPHLAQTGQTTGDSCIVNISATLQNKAQPFQLHAASAKAGIDVLTNTLGVEWAEYGIRVVGVAPGPIANTTGGPGGRVFGGALVPAKGSVEALRRTCPVGRYGEPADVGLLIVFLVGPAGGNITATTVVTDGGQWHGTSGMFLAAKDLVVQKSTKEKQTHRATPKSKL